jgi:hypothetical protein
MPSIFVQDPTNPVAHIEAIICVAFLCSTWIVIALRFWVRHRILACVGADDFLALVAQVSDHTATKQLQLMLQLDIVHIILYLTYDIYPQVLGLRTDD